MEASTGFESMTTAIPMQCSTFFYALKKKLDFELKISIHNS